jgi:hypothetical protein
VDLIARQGREVMSEEPTPQDYYDMIGIAVSDMMRAGATVRSDAGDEALQCLAFVLREALGLPQPQRH